MKNTILFSVVCSLILCASSALAMQDNKNTKKAPAIESTVAKQVLDLHKRNKTFIVKVVTETITLEAPNVKVERGSGNQQFDEQAELTVDPQFVNFKRGSGN